MSFDFGNTIGPFVGPFLGAIAAYLAIRIDIAHLKAVQSSHAADIKEAKDSALYAHARIDRMRDK